MGVPYPVKQRQVSQAIKEEKPQIKEEEDDIVEIATAQADTIIKEAKEEAQAILNSANEQAEKQVREATQKAKEEGYNHGEALAQKHYQELIKEAADLKQEAKTIYESTVSGLEDDMVEIITSVVRRVVGTELTQNKDVILGLIRSAVSGSTHIGKISIHVCQDDYAYVVENSDKIFEGFKGVRDYEVVKDNSLKKGECIVDTGFGTVDSSIETQLQSVERMFMELRGNTQEEISLAEAAFVEE